MSFIKIIDPDQLGDLPLGGDAVNYIEARECIDSEDIQAGLQEIAEKAPAWEPEPDPPISKPKQDEPAFIFHTAAEFDELDLRREYHIPGVLAAGPVPTVLAGSFKTLKTSIVMDMLLALATGAQFLNHFPVTRATSVAVMSGESGGFALQSLARRVATAKGWTVSSIGDRFRICTSVVSLGVARQLEQVERFIDENEVKLFVIDPTYLALRGLRNDDAGSLFAMGHMLEPLARIGERTGCTPMIVHHNSRGATRANIGEPAELADIAWSGFAEWAGQWILLSRRERYNPDSNGEHHLWLTAGGRDGHSNLVGVNVVEGRHDDPGGRRWDVEVEQATEARAAAAEAQQTKRDEQRQARREKQVDDDCDAILAVMSNYPGGETARTIRDAAGLSGSRFSVSLAKLIGENKVQECEICKSNNQKYQGYKTLGRTGTHWDK